MTAILCAMPESIRKIMMTPALERRLEALGDVTYCTNPRELSEEEYAALWEQADVVISGWSIRPPTREIIDRAKRLKIIVHTAGSVRMLPRYIIEKGIVVTTARAGIARTVAEFCLMNASMMLRRHLLYVDSDPARRAFYKPEGGWLDNETLFEKTVGIVGFGSVGRIFRSLLAPFGCRVIVYDPYVHPDDAARENVGIADLDTVLREGRVVSIHAPDIPDTNNMIGARELALVQDGAVLINSARGRIIDTDALTEALSTKRFFAALDVTEPEPLPEDHPLRHLPNVLWTPHIAGPTNDDRYYQTGMALTDLELYLQGKKPLYAMTLEGYDRMSF